MVLELVQYYLKICANNMQICSNLFQLSIFEKAHSKFLQLSTLARFGQIHPKLLLICKDGFS